MYVEFGIQAESFGFGRCVKYLSGDFAVGLGLRCIECELDSSPWVLKSLPTEKVSWGCSL